jgi:ribosome-associated translation inhibitor RaiA
MQIQLKLIIDHSHLINTTHIKSSLTATIKALVRMERTITRVLTKSHSHFLNQGKL